MSRDRHIQFDDYSELIYKPLATTDQRSLILINRLLQRHENGQLLAPGDTSPFSFLIHALTDVTIPQREARNHWKKLLEHKCRIEYKLGRTVNIRAATFDYHDQIGISKDMVTAAVSFAPKGAPDVPEQKNPERPTHTANHSSHADTTLQLMTVPGYYENRFKEEIIRARRYKHALSAIMFDVDLQAVPESSSAPAIRDKVLSLIVKMINKAVRTVDILARHSENDFLLILPNTNKREAQDLTERLRKNICQCTQRLPELSEEIPVTISVGQCANDDSSTDFVKRLDNLVKSGKQKTPNMVYSLD